MSAIWTVRMKQPYLERQVTHNKHILRLDVSVDDVLIVQNSQSPADCLTSPPDVGLLH
jgi:hypothetical protein